MPDRAIAHCHEAGTKRSNLVIVRAGNNSLHPMWLHGGAGRSWDLVVNYFGDDPEMYRQADVVRIDSKGPKWPALRVLIESNWDLVSHYDYIWLPDDDIACGSRDIDRIFCLARAYELSLSQPALTLDSYFSWLVTLRNPLLRVRFVNFVEIMVPCFKRDFLRQCLTSMSDNLTGWGLDHLWPTMLGPRQMAIFDAATVTHTRPIGGANYSFLRDRGIAAYEERDEFKRAYALGETMIRTDAVVTAWGFELDHGSRIMSELLRWGYGYALVQAYVLRRPNRRDFFGKRLRKAIISPAEFPE
jgi:hypothetical protein